MTSFQTPSFWYERRASWQSHCLAPLSWLYSALGDIHDRRRTVTRVTPAVVTVGNAVAGGAGKTPVVRSLASIAHTMGIGTHIVSHGYGGSLRHATRVNDSIHDAGMVGDEALLLASIAPTWVGKRQDALRAAATDAELVLLDDGFFDPHIHTDCRLLVVDGMSGFGNERVIPAGPLRRPLARALDTHPTWVMIGEDCHHLHKRYGEGCDVWRADKIFHSSQPIANTTIIAACGLARPQAFFAMIENNGGRLIASFAYPDHKPLPPSHIEKWKHMAKKNNASLAITAKDFVKIHPSQRNDIVVCDVTIAWHDEKIVRDTIKKLCP